MTLDPPTLPSVPTQLGDRVALELVPGAIVTSLDDLARLGEKQTEWVEMWREPFILDGKSIWLVALEHPGNEAALVVVHPADRGRWRVAAMLGVSQGGLGASVAVVERWFDGSKRTVLALVQTTMRFRSYKTAADEWMPAETVVSWTVLGLRADAAWLAWSGTSDVDPVHLVDTRSGPALAIHCSPAGATAAPAASLETRLNYQPRTGMFEGGCAARPQPPSTTGPTHP